MKVKLHPPDNGGCAYYRAHGYFVARAYLPAQDITGGEVEIAVLEGRIGTVTVKPVGPTRLDMRRAENLRQLYAPGVPGFYLPPEGGDATPH